MVDAGRRDGPGDPGRALLRRGESAKRLLEIPGHRPLLEPGVGEPRRLRRGARRKCRERDPEDREDQKERAARPHCRHSSSAPSDRIETGPLTVESRTTAAEESPKSIRRESSSQFFARLPARLRAALEGGTAGALDAHTRGVSLRQRQRERSVPGMGLEPSVPPVSGELHRDRAVLRVDVHVSSAAGDADRAVDGRGGDGARAGLHRDRAVARLRPDLPGRLLEGERAVLGMGGDGAGHPAHRDGPVGHVEIEAGAARRPDDQVHDPVAPFGSAHGELAAVE